MVKKKKDNYMLVLAAVSGLIILSLGLIVGIWWLAQSSPPGSDNETIQPQVSNNTSLPNITEPPIVEPNITEPFFTLSNQSDGVLVTTNNYFKFVCPNGWAVGIGHNEKFGNYDSYTLRCAKDGGSFVAIYSIVDSGEGPGLDDAMAVIKNEIQMEGGTDFKTVGSPTEYRYSVGSTERQGRMFFLSCGGKITIARTESPSSQFGSSIMTEISHSLQCD